MRSFIQIDIAKPEMVWYVQSGVYEAKRGPKYAGWIAYYVLLKCQLKVKRQS